MVSQVAEGARVVARRMGLGAGSWSYAPPRARDLADLRGALRGRLILPGEPGYTAAALPNNARWADVRPKAIAMCAGAEDVQACVDWARQGSHRFAVRSGGHSYAGFSTTDGLLVDVKPMNRVRFDEGTGLVEVGGGATNQDMADAMRGLPFAIPAGRCPTVGTSGLVLGGGWGFSATRSGLTCDSLRSTEVVTADGVRRTISDEGPDERLFWAVRGGGGGNFGVHTSFSFEPHHVGDVTTFNIVWPARLQVGLMLALQEIQNRNARSLSTRTKVAPGRGGTPGRDDLRVQTFGMFWGRPRELREVMAEAFTLQEPLIAEVNAMSYWSARDYLVTDDPNGLYDLRSSYVRGGLDGAGIETMLDWMTRWPGGSARQDNMGILFAIGGQVKAKAWDATAYVHRDADYIFEMETLWSAMDTPLVVERQQAWLGAYFEAMAPHVVRESYVNFPSRDLPDWAQAYYGRNLPELSRVKRRYDPDGLFRFPQSIPPGPPADGSGGSRSARPEAAGPTRQ